MRVAYLTSNLSQHGAGVMTVVEALSRAVSRGGVDIKVFGVHSGSHLPEPSSDWRGAPGQTFPPIGPKKLAFSPALTRALLNWQPDVVHVHGLWQLHGLSARQWHKTTRRPLLVSPHGMLNAWALKRSPIKKRISRFLFEDYNFRVASRIHVLSSEEKRFVADHGRTHGVLQIPNGVDSTDVTEADVHARKVILESTHTRRLLYLGRLQAKKGLMELIEAIALLKAQKRLDPWQLLIAGWSQEGHETALRTRILELGLIDKITFLGPVFGEAKKQLLRDRVDAVILPSQAEALPMTVLEAWSYGQPVVMTEACNLPEGFSEKAAVRISVKPKLMADGLAAFFALSDQQRLNIGAQGLKLSQSKFSWTSIAMQLISEYEGLWDANANKKDNNK